VYNKIYEIFIKQRPPALFVRASPVSRDRSPAVARLMKTFVVVATDAARRDC